jgi:hypothetical protein
MGIQLLLATSGAYMFVALGYIREGRYGMGLAFAAYALANVGFVIDMISETK